MPWLNRPKKKKLPRRPTSDRSFYSSKTWRKTRALKIAKDPFCEVHLHLKEYVDCTFNCPVDHPVPITALGHYTDERNLMTLCVSCHERKSSMESRLGCLVEVLELKGDEIIGQGENVFIPFPGERERLIKLLASKIYE